MIGSPSDYCCGAGSGILALAAAQAGAATVFALDINPNAAQGAAENACANGFGALISAVGSNLLSAVAPRPLFDVILSSPPSFPGEPRDMADRAWHAGPNYRDIAMLFAQAQERLASNSCMYVLFSTDSDLDLLGALISRAGFVASLVGTCSIVIESFLLYKLTVRVWAILRLRHPGPNYGTSLLFAQMRKARILLLLGMFGPRRLQWREPVEWWRGDVTGQSYGSVHKPGCCRRERRRVSQ